MLFETIDLTLTEHINLIERYTKYDKIL